MENREENKMWLGRRNCNEYLLKFSYKIYQSCESIITFLIYSPASGSYKVELANMIMFN